jgi:hypothetical protein
MRRLTGPFCVLFLIVSDIPDDKVIFGRRIVNRESEQVLPLFFGYHDSVSERSPSG